MDIVSASNIGMTNIYKDKKKIDKKLRIKHNKLYILVETKYIVDGVVGHNTIHIQICNAKSLKALAKKYYLERGLHRNRRWEDINIDKVNIEEAILILTKRKYSQIQVIDEDKIGETLRNNKIVNLISVDDFNW